MSKSVILKKLLDLVNSEKAIEICPSLQDLPVDLCQKYDLLCLPEDVQNNILTACQVVNKRIMKKTKFNDYIIYSQYEFNNLCKLCHHCPPYASLLCKHIFNEKKAYIQLMLVWTQLFCAVLFSFFVFFKFFVYICKFFVFCQIFGLLQMFCLWSNFWSFVKFLVFCKFFVYCLILQDNSKVIILYSSNGADPGINIPKIPDMKKRLMKCYKQCVWIWLYHISNIKTNDLWNSNFVEPKSKTVDQIIDKNYV